MSAQVNYICNGCGKWSDFGKTHKAFNILKVNMKAYVIFTSGFKLTRPEVELHLCDGCYDEVMRGEALTRSLGSASLMEEKCQKLEIALKVEKDDFRRYKTNVANLLKQGEV